MSPEWMTLEEVANYLRVTEITIYRLAHQGKIPASKVGKMWRFNKERIDKWLIEQEKVKSQANPREGEKHE
jgi:excisionase family DNA binding protein